MEAMLDYEEGDEEEHALHLQDGGHYSNLIREILEGEEMPPPIQGQRTKIRKAPKKWLDTFHVPYERKLANEMNPIFETAADSAYYVLFGLNTCLSECSNFRRLVFCRKDRF